MACIYTIVAKPMRALELHYPMILFLINFDISILEKSIDYTQVLIFYRLYRFGHGNGYL